MPIGRSLLNAWQSAFKSSRGGWLLAEPRGQLLRAADAAYRPNAVSVFSNGSEPLSVRILSSLQELQARWHDRVAILAQKNR
jgi:hypothetical protein